MKTPPFLLGGALLFWGWQAGFPLISVVMALLLEGARWLKPRWEFEDDDFKRIWTFCTFLFLAAAVYAFTSNQGPADFLGLFENPNFFTQRNAGTASARTAAALIRWLPMIFFLFVMAQEVSSQGDIPLDTMSLILILRWKHAKRQGGPPPARRGFNVSYPYFVICLFAASIRTGDDGSFFWGLCVLLPWALWSHRSPRFSFPIWAAALAVAIGLGYVGQRGIGQLQRLLENYNPSWFARTGPNTDPSQSRTALGHLGRMKSSSKIVLRVEPRDGVMAPNLLREASYRLYKVTTWYSEIAARDFTDLSSETNNTTWQLLPGKTNTSRLSIGCRLSGGRGLLALPDGSGRLENLPVIALHRNGLGAVLAEGPGALVFDACYGPGATLDSAPDGLASTNADLRVPEIEMPALDRAIEELHLTNREAALAMHAINEFFMSKFTYTLGSQYRIGVGTNFTALSYFLSRSHSGHCEYFATATVLLLRRLGIPARYAVGYAVHEASGSAYIVREGDAHAWCLVWDKKAQTWRNFDTTPASWIEEEAHRKSPLQFLSDAWFRIRIEISRFWWNQGRVRQYALWALLPVLLFLLYRIIFRRRRRDHGQSAGAASATAWPGLDSEFYQLEKKLTERGLIRGASEPMADWLRRALADPALAAFNEPLQNLLRLHYRYRFDPNGLTSNDREALGREARACLATVTQRRK